MNKRLLRAITLLSLIFALAAFLSSGNNVSAFSNPSSNPAGGAGSIYIEASTPANTLYLKSNGSVGIGVTNPTEKLDVTGDVYIAGAGGTIGRATLANGYLKIGTTLAMDPNEFYFGAPAYFGTVGANDLYIDTNGTTRMTVTSGGNIGIGKTPSTALDVNGTVTATAFAGPLSGSISAANVSSGSFGGNTGGGNYTFPANLGIGITTPAGKLHVVAATSGFPATSGTTQTGLIQRLQNADSNLAADFGANGGSGMWIQSTNSTSLGSTYPLLLNPNGGNVGIGTTAPGAKLEVAGSTLTNRENVSFYRNLIHYGTSTSTVTGTLKISFPKNWSSTMMKMKIDGYNYGGGSRGTSWSVVVSGYNYSSGQTWINYSAEISGAAPFNSVRLASDGTKNVVLLGTTTSTWSYPQIAVTEFMGGFSGYTGWDSGWAISFITDETGITGIVTPNIDFYRNSSGNIGIKTVTPTVELEVNGTVKATAFSGPLTGTNSAANVSSGDFGANTGGGNYSFPANVGIGTTTPAAKLDVVGGINMTGVLDSGSATASGYRFNGRSFSWNSSMQTPTSNVPHVFQQTYSGWDPVLGVKTTNGFWQMGAYSSDTLHLGYMTGAFGSHATNAFDNSIAITPSNVAIGNIGTMGLTVSGNVGIGNSSPTYKLDVVGDIHATGLIRTDGTNGWYSQTYGGGWFMQDTSWIRTYGAKNIWTSSGLIGGDGGLTVGYGGVTPPSGGGIIAGNVGIGTSAPATKLDVDGNITQSVTHGNNMKLWLSAARNGGGTGEVGLYSWISEPGMTWTGGGIARNMYNTTSWPRVNAALSGQMVHFTEGGNIDFTVETAAGSRTTPLTVSPGTATVTGTLTVTGNSNTCHLVSYSGGTTACPAGYYTWSGTALASGYMLCCKVDNPI